MVIKNGLVEKNSRKNIIKIKLMQIINFFAKMPNVTEVSLKKELSQQFKRLKPGIVLDIGSKFAPYKNQIPHTKYITLDINPRVKPDILSDVHKINWKSNYFDTIIATEILEHCYSPEKVVNEIYRLLKQEGISILSTRFIYPYHPDPKDYYRFTKDALEYLFRNFSKVEFIPHGNRLQVFWEIIPGRIFFIKNIFNSLIAKINFRDLKIHLGFVVYAQK